MITLDKQAVGDVLLPAEALRALCAEGDDLTVEGMRVVGRLDLAGVHLLHALRFVDCEFEDRIDLSDARADEPLEWTAGKVTSVLADRFESKAHVTLSEVSVAGTISMHWAFVQGDLRFTNSTLRPSQGVALNGRDLRVEGSLFLDGGSFLAEGEVCLRSAHIKQSVDGRHATFANPSGRSIDGYELSVDGELLCEDGFTAIGEVYLERAVIGRVLAGGGTFRNGDGQYPLRADAMTARSDVFLDRGCQTFGEVRLVGADIPGVLCCTSAQFSNPGGVALNGTRLRAEDVYLDRGFRADGAVQLDGAHLTRQLNCTSGQFLNEAGFALDGDGIQCDGSVFLDRGFIAKGEVRLVGAQIRNELNCTGGHFENPPGIALNADGLTTPGNVFLNSETSCEFTALGPVRLARATVGRQLILSGAHLTTNANALALDLSGLVCPGDVLLDDGCVVGGEVRMRGATIQRDLTFTGGQLLGSPSALDAQGVRVGACLSWQLAGTPDGFVDLSFAEVDQLDDTLNRWAEHKYALAGFTCRAPSENDLGVEKWITWLGQTRKHNSDAYQQLAASFRTSGDQTSAREIAIARQRDLRSERGDLRRGAKLWNLFLDKFTGYGYKLHRPMLALAILAVIGGIFFTLPSVRPLMQFQGSGSIEVPSFQPFVYSVQLLVPVVDLRETQVWLPNPAKAGANLVMLYIWVTVALGWLLSGALVAGLGRLYRQGEV